MEAPALFQSRIGAPARAARALRQMHRSGQVFEFRFELFSMIDEYLKVLAKLGAHRYLGGGGGAIPAWNCWPIWPIVWPIPRPAPIDANTPPAPSLPALVCSTSKPRSWA